MLVLVLCTREYEDSGESGMTAELSQRKYTEYLYDQRIKNNVQYAVLFNKCEMRRSAIHFANDF